MSVTENVMLEKILKNQSDILTILICFLELNLLLCLIYIVHGISKLCDNCQRMKQNECFGDKAIEDILGEDEIPSKTASQKPCKKSVPNVCLAVTLFSFQLW